MNAGEYWTAVADFYTANTYKPEPAPVDTDPMHHHRTDEKTWQTYADACAAHDPLVCHGVDPYGNPIHVTAH